METTTARHDEATLTVRIIEAIAAAADTDPLALEPPLYHVVDPEALAELVENGSGTGVQFEYNGHTVAVDGDGRVSVDGVVHERDGLSAPTSIAGGL